MIINIEPADLYASANYASAVWHHKDARQNARRRDDKDPIGRMVQNVMGRVAEFGAADLLETHPPSLTVLNPGQASHAPDLIDADGNRFHVKATMASDPWQSWVAETADPATFAPHSRDFFVLVFVQDQMDAVDIRWVIHANDLLAKWRKPFSRGMQGRKVAVYDSDLLADPFIRQFQL